MARHSVGRGRPDGLHRKYSKNCYKIVQDNRSAVTFKYQTGISKGGKKRYPRCT